MAKRAQATWTYDDVIRRHLAGPDPRPVRPKVAPWRHHCRAHPAKVAKCSCRYCERCCTQLCRNPDARRAQSACLRCAWCAVCGRRFAFSRLTITGPDLCGPCLRGDGE